ncbi:pilus assembly protein PilO [Yersinia massiliensis]|uniref:pilus assembly protein PilO n=1 Tax=Yersinia massiliensis TaxID=419257 RepID=UPI001643CC1C|nr:pilus assembly protein PilO [Yersinia massiliensis]
MNKTLQHWMDRPGWQLCLWQWGLLGLFSTIAYGMLLRPAWQQQRMAESNLIQAQQQIEHQQSILAALPALSLIRQQIVRQQIAAAAEEESAWQQNDRSLAHLVGQLIAPFGGQVVAWQRQSEPRTDVEPDLFQLRQWHATLRVNFHGLLHLFHHLSQSSAPIQVERVEVKSTNTELIVTMSLKEYLVGSAHE